MYLCNINIVNIENLLNSKYSYFAHFVKDRKETLKDHTDLTVNYFKQILKEKCIDKVLENFEIDYLKKVSKEGKEVFRELLVNLFVFHDLGKINPLFQITKMDNKNIEKEDEFLEFSSNHSIISSVLYIDYFFERLKAIENKDEYKILRGILLANAYVITKHHGDLYEFDIFLDSFDEGGTSYKVISLFNNGYKNVYKHKFSLSNARARKMCDNTKKYLSNQEEEKNIYLYIYVKLVFSLLVASDFYATSSFSDNVDINDFGNIDDIAEFYDVYKKTSIFKGIRSYEKQCYLKRDLYHEKEINILRNELFLDAEKRLMKNINSNLFFLEAPTGGGKSNVAMNLTFKLMENDKTLNKIYYVYPFNTLIEQNIATLKKIFEKNEKLFNKVAVINSIVPIKINDKLKNEEDDDGNNEYYKKAFLNREFLNYPFILTTHVSIFETMFGSSKESNFKFHQLVNSVIVLDEIQSYKNTLWTEIIRFLKAYAKILNIRIIIMSATLPDLTLLTKDKHPAVNLIKNREKYFLHPLFKDRVKIDYSLIKADLDEVYLKVKEFSYKTKRILIEFISKESANNFFYRLREDTDINCTVELITGDDNIIERNRILNLISSKDCKSIILVATQVVEAGVDIDMDIGFKDISSLDRDEQFLGRINRSCKGEGLVFFFDHDRESKVYKEDFRINKEFSLRNDYMKNVLLNKDFKKFYSPVLSSIESSNNELNDNNIEEFFKDKVGQLDFNAIEERMKLIDDDAYKISVFLCSNIKLKDGTIIEGHKVWDRYEELLKDTKMDYAKKQVLLSKVRSEMNYFLYDIKRCNTFIYSDKIGEIYFIEDGESYFKEGKLDREKFIKGVGEFI